MKRVCGGNPVRRTLRFTGLSLALMAAVICSPGYAKETDTQEYDIYVPRQDVAAALNKLAEQTDTVLLYPFKAAKARQSKRGGRALLTNGCFGYIASGHQGFQVVFPRNAQFKSLLMKW